MDFCIPSPLNSRWKYSYVPSFTVSRLSLSVSCLPEGQGFVSEDEYLEISDIKRDQSGEYECSALNDVAAPDVRKVKITVNCEWTYYRGVPGSRRAWGRASNGKAIFLIDPSCFQQENTV